MRRYCDIKETIEHDAMDEYRDFFLSAECLIIFEDERLGARARGASLSGPELASLMKIGTRVVRGKDWKWGDQVKITQCFIMFFKITMLRQC